MNKEQFVSKIFKSLLSCNMEIFNKLCLDNKGTILYDRPLYKYTAIDKYSIDNLLKGLLWLNKPRNFNDPFDCWVHKERIKLQFEDKATIKMMHDFSRLLGIHEIDFTASNWIQTLEEMLPEQERNKFIKQKEDIKHRKFNGYNNAIGEKMYITCLSEYSPTGAIMWSHYGDYHKGMCLEYDFSKCVDDCYSMLMPVIYLEHPPIININSNNVSEDDDLHCFLFLTILCKSIEWKYEKEWRMIKSLEKFSDNDCPNTAPYLKHIYLGACVEEFGNDYNKIIKIANVNGIAVSKMQRSDKDYSFQPIPI